LLDEEIWNIWKQEQAKGTSYVVELEQILTQTVAYNEYRKVCDENNLLNHQIASLRGSFKKLREKLGRTQSYIQKLEARVVRLKNQGYCFHG